jgi:hypothetical protein
VLDIAGGRWGDGVDLSGAGHKFSSELAERLMAQQQGLARFEERYVSCPDGRGKAFMVEVLVSTGDPEAFLLASGDALGRSIIARRLHMSIGDVAYRKDPPLKRSGTYELIPIDASVVRAGLFDLFISGDADASEFANVCLEALDRLRDEEGHLDTEPRHPNIETMLPWPRIWLS